MKANVELNDENLIRAIYMKVIPVATYPMNGYKFTKNGLHKLHQLVKREKHVETRKGKNTLGR